MKSPKTIRILAYSTDYKSINDILVPTYKDKDSWGYNDSLPNGGTYRVSLADSFTQASSNVTFLISQLVMIASARQLIDALNAAGIFMPDEYDWSFIRDAERHQKLEMAKLLLRDNKNCTRIKGLFAGEIAKNLGLMS